jgi:tRNA dimethylallyltransferase
VKHYFIADRSITEDYNAGQYERDALALMDQLFAAHDTLIMTGGSMLYADAVCKGLDDLPAVPDAIRAHVNEQHAKHGLAWLQQEVQRLDPNYWTIVDQNNPARLKHCVELCLATGSAYSSLRTQPHKERPFRIVKVGLDRPRAELYARINERVLQMMEEGLLQEAEKVYAQRHLNSLQTVGYRELFGYLSGEYDLDRAIELIQQNSRHYAKRQLTWFRRDSDIHWLDARNDYETNIHCIDGLLDDDCVQAE